MVCLWACRGIVLRCGAFFGVYGLWFICCVLFLVCLRFGRYVSWCLRYMMCTVFSMSAFCLLVVGVFVLVCRRFRVYDVCCF